MFHIVLTMLTKMDILESTELMFMFVKGGGIYGKNRKHQYPD